jgi:hypothetical protein
MRASSPWFSDFLVQHTKTGKNIPNGYKIYQMDANVPNDQKIYQHLPLKPTQKFTQIWIFGLKIYHLATLIESARWQK